jgi:propionyl-CoA carboxylase alpha chain
MQHPRFRSGELTTGFIAEEYPDGFARRGGFGRSEAQARAIAGLVATAIPDRARMSTASWRQPAPPIRMGRCRSTIAEPRRCRSRGRGLSPSMASRWNSTDGICAGRQRMVMAESRRRNLAVKIAKPASGFQDDDARRDPQVRCCPPHSRIWPTHMIEKIPPDLSKFLICPMPGLLVALMSRATRSRRVSRWRGRGDEDGKHPARRKVGRR